VATSPQGTTAPLNPSPRADLARIDSEPARSSTTTRIWLAAAVAVAFAITGTGVAAALWHRNQELGRQVEAMQTALAGVSRTVGGLTAGAEHQGEGADDLTARLQAVEDATRQLDRLDAVDRRLDELEASTQRLETTARANATANATATPTPPSTAGLAKSADVRALRSEVDDLRSQVSTVSGDLSGVRSDVDSLCRAMESMSRRGKIC
jgi:uncharacterized protein YoxC